jgi:hypothetical protein
MTARVFIVRETQKSATSARSSKIRSNKSVNLAAAAPKFACGRLVERKAFAPIGERRCRLLKRNREPSSAVPDPYVLDPIKLGWLRIGVAGQMGERGTQVDLMAVARIRLHPDRVAARLFLHIVIPQVGQATQEQ